MLSTPITIPTALVAIIAYSVEKSKKMINPHDFFGIKFKVQILHFRGAVRTTHHKRTAHHYPEGISESYREIETTKSFTAVLQGAESIMIRRSQQNFPLIAALSLSIACENLIHLHHEKAVQMHRSNIGRFLKEATNPSAVPRGLFSLEPESIRPGRFPFCPHQQHHRPPQFILHTWHLQHFL